jgi:hypothetical protein
MCPGFFVCDLLITTPQQTSAEFKKDFLAMAANGGKCFVLDLEADQAVECLCAAVTTRVLYASARGGKEGDRLVDEYEKKYGGFGYT